MPTIKVRFKLNPGREGIALNKLARHAENIERLVQSAARDVGVSENENVWLAKKFNNGSVYCTAELQAVATVAQEADFRALIKGLAVGPRRPVKGAAPPVELPRIASAKTVAAFADLKDPLDMDESVGVGLWDGKNSALKWNNVPRLRLAAISNAVDAIANYVGAVTGSTYEWNKGADAPFIKIRDVATGELVRCNYSASDYGKVAKLFELRDSLVTVYGNVTFDRISGKTEIQKATDFEVMPQLSDEDYKRFFGCAPNMSGTKSGAEYVREDRDQCE